MRARLRLTFAVFALGLALLLALIQARELQVEREAGAGRALAADASEVSESLERALFERYRELAALASMPSIRDTRAFAGERSKTDFEA